MNDKEIADKKRWLWRYQRCRSSEKQLRRQIALERERATATTKAMSPIMVTSSKENTMESAILKIVERQEKLYKQIIKTEIVRDEIETAINSLPDDRMKAVLQERYIIGTSRWWRIAKNLNISEVYAKKLERRALEKLYTPVYESSDTMSMLKL